MAAPLVEAIRHQNTLKAARGVVGGALALRGAGAILRDRRAEAVLFLQAEDGIRDLTVTGVQTCALPICAPEPPPDSFRRREQLDVAREWTRGEHRVHPLSSAATATECGTSRVVGKRVQIGGGGPLHAPSAILPHTRTRATPPSGKMFSRTCVTGPRTPRGTGNRCCVLARSVARGTSSRQPASSGDAPPVATPHPSRHTLSGKLPLTRRCSTF